MTGFDPNTLVIAGMALAGITVSGYFGPRMLARSTATQRATDRLEDYRRQDEVAARAEAAIKAGVDATNLVALQATEAAKLLKESNAKVEAATVKVAEQAAVTDGKLDTIHTLVNSTLSAAKEAELTALDSQLTFMRRVEVTPELTAAIAEVQSRADVLRAEVADRLVQAKVAEESIVKTEAAEKVVAS